MRCQIMVTITSLLFSVQINDKRHLIPSIIKVEWLTSWLQQKKYIYTEYFIWRSTFHMLFHRMCWIRITINWVWSLESIKKTLVWQLMHNKNDAELAFLYESSIVGSYFSTKIPWTNWTVWRAREKEDKEGKTKRKDMFIKCNDTQTWTCWHSAKWLSLPVADGEFHFKHS